MSGRALHLRVVADHTSGAEGARTDLECLEYMADLILQLRQMADERGHAVLGGILEVAYQEAKCQAWLR
jgi:hypothetical protein